MYAKYLIVALSILQVFPGLNTSPAQDNRQHNRLLQQDGYKRFIEISSSKVLFAIMVEGDWEYVTNYCHTYGMYAASIDDQTENDLVTAHLASSLEIDSFWLPATDYITEGTFSWVRTKLPVAFSNFNTGSPSIDRTKNCVAIQKDGTWTEELCASNDVRHFGLCELPFLTTGPATTDAKVDDKHSKVQKLTAATTRISLDQAKSLRLDPIGEVGTKQYFKDETLTARKLYQALDFCHVLGMRLVTVETTEELQFLGDYSRQMAEEGGNPLILTSGSDILSVRCNSGNAFFRWFYYPETVDLDGNFQSHWHKCLVISPEGFFTPDCIGFLGWTLCELDTAA